MHKFFALFVVLLFLTPSIFAGVAKDEISIQGKTFSKWKTIDLENEQAIQVQDSGLVSMDTGESILETPALVAGGLTAVDESAAWRKIIRNDSEWQEALAGTDLENNPEVIALIAAEYERTNVLDDLAYIEEVGSTIDGIEESLEETTINASGKNFSNEFNSINFSEKDFTVARFFQHSFGDKLEALFTRNGELIREYGTSHPLGARAYALNQDILNSPGGFNRGAAEPISRPRWKQISLKHFPRKATSAARTGPSIIIPAKSSGTPAIATPRPDIDVPPGAVRKKPFIEFPQKKPSIQFPKGSDVTVERFVPRSAVTRPTIEFPPEGVSRGTGTGVPIPKPGGVREIIVPRFVERVEEATTSRLIEVGDKMDDLAHSLNSQKVNVSVGKVKGLIILNGASVSTPVVDSVPEAVSAVKKAPSKWRITNKRKESLINSWNATSKFSSKPVGSVFVGKSAVAVNQAAVSFSKAFYGVPEVAELTNLEMTRLNNLGRYKFTKLLGDSVGSTDVMKYRRAAALLLGHSDKFIKEEAKLLLQAIADAERAGAPGLAGARTYFITRGFITAEESLESAVMLSRFSGNVAQATQRMEVLATVLQEAGFEARLGQVQGLYVRAGQHVLDIPVAGVPLAEGQGTLLLSSVDDVTREGVSLGKALEHATPSVQAVADVGKLVPEIKLDRLNRLRNIFDFYQRNKTSPALLKGLSSAVQEARVAGVTSLEVITLGDDVGLYYKTESGTRLLVQNVAQLDDIIKAETGLANVAAQAAARAKTVAEVTGKTAAAAKAVNSTEAVAAVAGSGRVVETAQEAAVVARASRVGKAVKVVKWAAKPIGWTAAGVGAVGAGIAAVPGVKAVTPVLRVAGKGLAAAGVVATVAALPDRAYSLYKCNTAEFQSSNSELSELDLYVNKSGTDWLTLVSDPKNLLYSIDPNASKNINLVQSCIEEGQLYLSYLESAGYGVFNLKNAVDVFDLASLGIGGYYWIKGDPGPLIESCQITFYSTDKKNAADFIDKPFSCGEGLSNPVNLVRGFPAADYFGVVKVKFNPAIADALQDFGYWEKNSSKIDVRGLQNLGFCPTAFNYRTNPQYECFRGDGLIKSFAFTVSGPIAVQPGQPGQPSGGQPGQPASGTGKVLAKGCYTYNRTVLDKDLESLKARGEKEIPFNSMREFTELIQGVYDYKDKIDVAINTQGVQPLKDVKYFPLGNELVFSELEEGKDYIVALKKSNEDGSIDKWYLLINNPSKEELSSCPA